MAATALGGAVPSHAIPLSRDCRVPDALLALRGDLSRLARRMKRREVVEILAMGTLGEPVRGARSYRLVRELRRRFPAERFEMLHYENPGETAPDFLDTLKRIAYEIRPDLVIWQVGANDAMESVDPEEFTDAVEEGARWLSRRAIDVVLMDPRYFPLVRYERAYQFYSDRLGSVAREEGLPLMRRYRAMRHWAGKVYPTRHWKGNLVFLKAGERCMSEILAEAIARRVWSYWEGRPLPPAPGSNAPAEGRRSAKAPPPAKKPGKGT